MKGKRVIAGILLAGILTVTLAGCTNTGDSRNTDSGKCTECNTAGSVYTD